MTAAALAFALPTASAEAVAVSFAQTGAEQAWTVPMVVTLPRGLVAAKGGGSVARVRLGTLAAGRGKTVKLAVRAERGARRGSASVRALLVSPTAKLATVKGTARIR